MNAPTRPQSPLETAIAACRTGFLAVAGFSLFVNLLMLTVPIYMMQIYDRVLSSRSIDTLLMLLLIAGVALLVLAILDAVRGFLLVRISEWLDGHLSGHVLTETIAFQLRRTGAPTVQGLRDLGNVRTFLTGASIFPIMDAPWTPIFLAVIFMLHPALGILAIVGAILLFAIALANEITTRDLLLKAGAANMVALADAETAVRNADVVEAMGMMPNLINRWHKRNSEATTLQTLASTRSNTLTSSSKFLRFLLQIGVLTLGAWLVLQGELTSGGMIAASILMSRALAPVEQAIGTWKMALSARESYARIKGLLGQARERGNAMPLPTPKGILSVENVVYGHPNQSEPVLRNIAFQLAPGEAMGLIGPTASGKTTLARLLVGNLAPRTGHVRLDGMDVSQWEREDLGRHVGYLPQDVELFGGTIKENIARMGEGDPEKVIEAARMAGVHEMILGMPKGYDSEIGPGGMSLSGGQRQRIGLARALYGNPRLVVLDEPNASLDREGEIALLNAIVQMKQKSITAIIIAHRPGILRRVDKILALKSGSIMMYGPRDEVLEKLSAPQGTTAQAGGQQTNGAQPNAARQNVSVASSQPRPAVPHGTARPGTPGNPMDGE